MKPATHVGDLVAGTGEFAGLADGDEAGAEPHRERGAEKEAPGVKADDVVNLGDLVLWEGDGVEMREKVGEEHLEVLRVAQEREEVDEGDALLREIGCRTWSGASARTAAWRIAGRGTNGGCPWPP